MSVHAGDFHLIEGCQRQRAKNCTSDVFLAETFGMHLQADAAKPLACIPRGPALDLVRRIRKIDGKIIGSKLGTVAKTAKKMHGAKPH